MKNPTKKSTKRQEFICMPYVLLAVKERIQDGSFFDLSSRAQSLLHVLASGVQNTRSGMCLYQRDAMSVLAGIRLDAMSRTVDELSEAGLVEKGVWSHGKKVLTLPIKLSGLSNHSDRYVYLESWIVSGFVWSELPPYAKSVYWLLKGYAVSGARSNNPYVHNYVEYAENAKTADFELVPDNYIGSQNGIIMYGHEIIKKSRWNYTRGLKVLKDLKIVYNYEGKYAKGLAIKNSKLCAASYYKNI